MDKFPHHKLSPSTGAMLREIRKSKGWTLARTAAEVGCDLSYLSVLETAQRAPSKAMAMDIVFALGLNREQAQLLLSESVDGVGRDKASRKAKATT